MGETIMKHRGCGTRPTAPLAVRADSRAISKLKPKIRIVHIVAPEVIQTDAANFRDLVQRLTGKPSRRVKPAPAPAPGQASDHRPEAAVVGSLHGYRDAPSVKVEVEAEELWLADNPCAALLGGLADLDGFMQGLSELPLVPLSSSHEHLFGEDSTSASE
uniref:Protein MKS1 n=1 Tax=Anthurium amnicola TaxID=1678845 RepID=A0A1D1YQT0_9ARAE